MLRPSSLRDSGVQHSTAPSRRLQFAGLCDCRARPKTLGQRPSGRKRWRAGTLEKRQEVHYYNLFRIVTMRSVAKLLVHAYRC